MRQLDQTMAHSDTEDVYEPGEAGLKQPAISDNLLENEAYEKNIHSGHFMVSHVHESTERNINDIADSEHSTESRDSLTYGDDFNENSKLTTIDSSLTKLFKCMSIVEKYFSNRGTLTSPKWKNFKGIKVRQKEKIRLNNIIWREWHMQFVKGANHIVCHFSSPLADNIQNTSTSYNRIHRKRQWSELRDHWKKMDHISHNKYPAKHQNIDCLSETKPYCEIIQRSSENNSRRLTSLGGIMDKALFNHPDMDFDPDFPYNNLLFNATNLKEVPAYSEGHFPTDNTFSDFFEQLQSSFRNELGFQKSSNNFPDSQLLINDKGELYDGKTIDTTEAYSTINPDFNLSQANQNNSNYTSVLNTSKFNSSNYNTSILKRSNSNQCRNLSNIEIANNHFLNQINYNNDLTSFSFDRNLNTKDTLNSNENLSNIDCDTNKNNPNLLTINDQFNHNNLIIQNNFHRDYNSNNSLGQAVFTDDGSFRGVSLNVNDDNAFIAESPTMVRLAHGSVMDGEERGTNVAVAEKKMLGDVIDGADGIFNFINSSYQPENNTNERNLVQQLQLQQLQQLQQQQLQQQQHQQKQLFEQNRNQQQINQQPQINIVQQHQQNTSQQQQTNEMVQLLNQPSSVVYLQNNPSNNQSTNQSINQSNSQSVNQPINSQTVSQPLNQILFQPLNQPINQPLNQTLNQPINQSLNQPINQPINPSLVNHLVMANEQHSNLINVVIVANNDNTQNNNSVINTLINNQINNSNNNDSCNNDNNNNNYNNNNVNSFINNNNNTLHNNSVLSDRIDLTEQALLSLNQAAQQDNQQQHVVNSEINLPHNNISVVNKDVFSDDASNIESNNGMIVDACGMVEGDKLSLFSKLLQQLQQQSQQQQSQQQQLSENQKASQQQIHDSQLNTQQQQSKQLLEGSQHIFQQEPNSVFTDDSSQHSSQQQLFPQQQLFSQQPLLSQQQLFSQQQIQQPSFLVDQQQFMILKQQQQQQAPNQQQTIQQQNQLIQIVNQSNQNSTQQLQQQQLQQQQLHQQQLHQQQLQQQHQQQQQGTKTCQQLEQKSPFIIQLPPGFHILQTDSQNQCNTETVLPTPNINHSLCQSANTNTQQNIQQINQEQSLQQITHDVTQHKQHNNNNQDCNIDSTNNNISSWNSNIFQQCPNNKPTFKIPQKHHSARLRQTNKCNPSNSRTASESSSSPPISSTPSHNRVFNMKDYIQEGRKTFKEATAQKNLLNASSFEKKRRIRVRGSRLTDKDTEKTNIHSKQSSPPCTQAPSCITTCHRILKNPTQNSVIEETLGSEYSTDTTPSHKLGLTLKSSQHKTAEQLRRFSIKCGLNALNERVPSLCKNTGCRVSKTTTLNKTVNYIKKLKDERRGMEDEIERLKAEKNLCEREIKMFQDQLPATGMPNKSCLQSPAHQQQLHTSIRHYVHQQSQQNNKFWIFLLLVEPLFTSLQHLLFSADVADFSKALFNWLNQRCSLISLRPMFSNSLRKLSTSTCILSQPEEFEGQIREMIQQAVLTDTLPLNPPDQHPSSHRTSLHDALHDPESFNDVFNVPLNNLTWR